MSKYSEVKRIKKNLPYTVSDIPDISVWRLSQADKDKAWEMKKEVKRHNVITSMKDGSLVAKEFAKSTTTKAYDRMLADKLMLNNYPTTIMIKPLKPSILTQVKNWLTDWFLSIKF